jgi:hypothetical protein
MVGMIARSITSDICIKFVSAPPSDADISKTAAANGCYLQI